MKMYIASELLKEKKRKTYLLRCDFYPYVFNINLK